MQVLYKLSEEDFATICSTEGVRSHTNCIDVVLYPTYLGDGERAGMLQYKRSLKSKAGIEGILMVVDIHQGIALAVGD